METAIVHADSGSTVRMRSGPGKGYTPVLSVPVDMEVDVLEWGPEWSLIRVDGEEGYMMSQYLHRPANGATLEQRLAELEKRMSQIEEKMGAGT